MPLSDYNCCPNCKTKMIDWPDGEARAPSNETMRQIPQPYGTWATQTWISRTGTVWKRYYNFQLGRWHWDDGPTELILEDDTEVDIWQSMFMFNGKFSTSRS